MTKVDIISGFLGAGKTTFIKQLVQDVFAGEKLVLIENEFGEIDIMTMLVKAGLVPSKSCLLYTSLKLKISYGITKEAVFSGG